MAWVTFTAAFDWTPPENRRVTIAYPAGATRNVTRDCAKAAKAKGVAVTAKRPRSRDEANAVRAAVGTLSTTAFGGGPPPPMGEEL